MIRVAPLDAAAAALRARVADAADGRDVTIVAVTKGLGVEAWEAARAVGFDDVGESYAQEARAKWAAWDAAHPGVAPPRLHVIGRLQTNKVRSLVGHVALWQSVDREELVDEVARRDPGAAVLVQVNLGGGDHQGGVPPTDAVRLVSRAAAAGLDVRGLMAIGAERHPEAARSGFARLRALATDLGLPECSMGMSDDLDVAVAEGATMVRVGTALFGPRPTGTRAPGPPSPIAPPSMGQDAPVRRQR